MSTNRLPPEALECIAAHLLALEWLAGEVQHPSRWAALSSDPEMLVFEAQSQGVRRYRQMSPDQLREACDRALGNYRVISTPLNPPDES
ncbi:hypothetical protein PGN35_025245 [Nodosilinea sp. PGN35]|uniref:hypothetical protein n=1 Tax=Nodosilinea sp. PGN35 TaxID=3020489 RepID=UPI0023B2CB54|nr:hypothetical protein [Nodosilinea sp. TSF1-S3]MDF0367459.1 hypothetical protein [Nodosilinea sp. TSF1-S3]